jgi:hypothetical protein
MTATQKPGTNTWFEGGAPDSDAPVRAYPQKDVNGDWVFATTGPQDGAFVWDGDGYVLVDLTAEYPLIASAGDYLVASSGTPVAQLNDDDGDALVSTTLTDPPVAHIYPDDAGGLYVAMSDGPVLNVLSAGGNLATYEA